MSEILIVATVTMLTTTVVFAHRHPEFHSRYLAPSATAMIGLALMALVSWNMAVVAASERIVRFAGALAAGPAASARDAYGTGSSLVLIAVAIGALVVLWVPAIRFQLTDATPEEESAPPDLWAEAARRRATATDSAKDGS